MKPFEHSITVVLKDGTSLDYFPSHAPVSQQSGSTITFAWESQEDERGVYSLAINTENIVALEMVGRREDQDEEVLRFIDEAKRRQRDAEDFEERSDSHPQIHRQIIAMLQSDEKLKERALFLKDEDEPTDEEKRTANGLLGKLGMPPIYESVRP